MHHRARAVRVVKQTACIRPAFCVSLGEVRAGFVIVEQPLEAGPLSRGGTHTSIVGIHSAGRWPNPWRARYAIRSDRVLTAPPREVTWDNRLKPVEVEAAGAIKKFRCRKGHTAAVCGSCSGNLE
ncbi:hypothetical protein MHYP_G00362090 [Metynnis hypsauchen]